MEPQWNLELSLVGPYGERSTIAVALTPETAQSIQKVEPPSPLAFAGTNVSPFDECIKILKRREFRKNLFTDAAKRLGTLLAERMEDKEGWHGVSRQENLEDWGSRL